MLTSTNAKALGFPIARRQKVCLNLATLPHFEVTIGTKHGSDGHVAPIIADEYCFEVCAVRRVHPFLVFSEQLRPNDIFEFRMPQNGFDDLVVVAGMV